MTRSRSGSLLLLIVAVLFILGGVVIALAVRDTGEQRASTLAYAPGAYVEGTSLDAWTARHWQWTLSFPVSSYPGYSATGEDCGAGQSGPVFFLPRNMPSCTIPEGLAILVPVVGVECSTKDQYPFTGASENELRACAEREADRYTNISVIVDGKTLPNVHRYRAGTPLFDVILPENNILGAPGGAAWVLADGYSIILKPLPPGEHVIIVHSELADGTILPDERVVLTIVEPSWSPVSPAPDGATPVATRQIRRQ